LVHLIFKIIELCVQANPVFHIGDLWLPAMRGKGPWIGRLLRPFPLSE